MEASSKVIMGGIVIMVVTLAFVLGLVLVLLAELYCSLLLRRRQLRSSPVSSHPSVLTANDASSVAQSRSLSQLLREDSGTSSLATFYEQGVLRAPRSFLFPSFHDGKDKFVDMEKQHSQLPEDAGCMFSPQQSPPFSPFASPKLVPIDYDEVCGSRNRENYVYICNPIYDDDANRGGRVDNTPFGTPDSSPSRLENVGSSSEEDNDDVVVVRHRASCPSSESGPPITPPLSPMKELPAQASSVSLREVGPLATTGSGSISSSPSSVSSNTSPSW